MLIARSFICHCPWSGLALLPLEPEAKVAVCRSAEEGWNLAPYHVKAEDERKRITEAGHRRMLAEHTYQHRMKIAHPALDT